MDDMFNSMISNGLYLSVVCAEDFPFWPESEAKPLTKSYLSNIENELRHACTIWLHEEVNPSFKQPVISDIPVLLLSGELDPVTPPSNADHAAKKLSKSLHIVVPGHGHGVLQRGCLPKLAAQFFKTLDFSSLETDCVSKIEPMPFFTSNAGPEP